MSGNMTYEDGTRIVALIERLIGDHEEQGEKIDALAEENRRLKASLACRMKGWQWGEVKSSILRTEMGHHCAYVTFPKRFLLEDGYYGILTYVPVHGGITFAERDKDTGEMTYGFDCAHSGDDDDPQCHDLDWLTAECNHMAIAIKMAQEYEEPYLRADGNEARALVIEQYHAALSSAHDITFQLTDNFGAMINALSGSL